MNQNITEIREVVNALFLNPTTLRLKVTDYHVDQLAHLVECLSDEMYPKEKMCLLDQVKLAKRLSQKRNLLNYGDFESSNWLGENGWKTNNYVAVASGHHLFKGRYLKLSGVTAALSGNLVSTYVYQKVEESKLKPYTRYMVRGFVGNSKDLEVFVARYDKEVHKKMNVPDDIPPTNPCMGEFVVEKRPYPVIRENRIVPHTGVVCQDAHEFTFHIDTGELDMDRNLGIWVGFKIGTTDGMATLDNIEVVEVGPLIEGALAHIKKRERKRKQKWTEKRIQIKKAVQEAQDAIQDLFTCPLKNRLKWGTTLNSILQTETLIQKIPYMYNQLSLGNFPVLPREVFEILQQLSTTVATARALYEQRNVLRNGDFNAGLANWNGTEGANIQQIGNASVLVISDWSASLSQHVYVKPEHSYLLRVTARKEGSGEGYVKISDGTEENIETLNFIAGEEAISPVTSNISSNLRECYNGRHMMNSSTEAYGTSGYASNTNMMNYPPDNYGANAYPGNNDMNYQSESFGVNPYGDENNMMNSSSNNYEMNAYPTTNMQTNQGLDGGCGCGCHHSTNEYPVAEEGTLDLSGYVTKTVEIFPETTRVCIDIGEIAGTFMVESIELIRMEQTNELNHPAVDVQPVATYMPTEQSDSISSAESSVRPRHFHYAYVHDEYIGYVNPNWMAQLSDYNRFSQLSIPGTHDTMAFYGGDISQCQTMSLTTQLNAGIRYLDIRCRHMDNIFYIYHGIIYQKARFEDVCDDVSAFLRTNPSETIFMRIKEESTPSNNTRSFADTFADYKSRYSNLFWNYNDYDPRLGEIRGKVVVLQDFSSDDRFGIPYWYLEIQDNYHLDSNWDLYDKWLDVKEYLYEADLSFKKGNNPTFLNYLSGSGGSFPYFVASGHSSPGTSAPRLSTGLTTPAFADWYPDFPRINCAGNVCTIAFEGTNILTSDWIEKSDFHYVGIIAADFPGGGLIDNIIHCNRGIGIQNNGVYQIVTALNNSSVVDLNQENGNVTLWSNNNGNNQKWRFVYDSMKNAYQIRSIANENLALTWDVESFNVEAAPIKSSIDFMNYTQFWIPQRMGGYYSVRPASRLDTTLDVSGSSTNNGTNIQIWWNTGRDNQKFKLQKLI
ncbi:phosphatidylinositol-specific phospholipase C domain-containing protein [Bacillus thuringiensis]|uniref:phosphatidylinositol-specific phospholipase C domain-containing protein n=1 Tax=Bacillus thuringiensis TaxID=1428 RepID=UPI003335FFA7